MNKKELNYGLLPNLSTIEDVHRYYRKIISCMPNNVYWLDTNCIHLGCNNNVLNMLGVTMEEYIGKTYEALDKIAGWKEGVAESFKRDDTEVLNTGIAKLNVEEPPLYNKEGNPVYYISSRVPIFSDNGNVIGVVGISVDVTQQKETEKKLADQITKTEKAYRSKGRFIAQASHEIRNPISSVSGMLNLIKERLDKLQVLIYEKMGSLKDTDLESIDELNTIFKETFDFYNIASEKTDASLNALKNLEKLHLLEIEGLKPKWLQNSISELLEEAIKDIPYNSNRKTTELKINIMDDVPTEALIDYDHIRDALSIIIGNAIRFSADNSQVLIDVKTYNDEQAICLDFMVKDFGMGIAKEQLDGLFKSEIEDEFTTDERLRKPSVQLRRAKLMIEASGGKLIINSVLKLGTTVTIRAPFRLPEQQDFIADPKKTLLTQLAKIHPCKILVIEDDLSIQQTTVKQLNELGFHNIDVASSGHEALKKGMHGNYEIVFVDFSLPDINGIRVVEQLLRDKNEDIIFIGITSHTSEEIETHALKSGVMEVLFKPVTKPSLAQALKAALQIILDNTKPS